jgi:hypothetical protein
MAWFTGDEESTCKMNGETKALAWQLPSANGPGNPEWDRRWPQNGDVGIAVLKPLLTEEMKKLFIISRSYISSFDSLKYTINICTICKRNIDKILTSQYNCLKLRTLSSGKTCLYNLSSLRGKVSSVSRT